MTPLTEELCSGMTWREATNSDQHPDLVPANREQAETFKSAMVRTSIGLFLPIRTRWGAQRVSSFFRFDRLNIAVGGSEHSQHKVGCAIDIVPLHAPLREVWEWIAFESKLYFGQCLLEGYGKGTEPKWIHVSTRDGRAPARCDEVGYGPSNAIVFVGATEKFQKRGGIRWA